MKMQTVTQDGPGRSAGARRSALRLLLVAAASLVALCIWSATGQAYEGINVFDHGPDRHPGGRPP